MSQNSLTGALSEDGNNQNRHRQPAQDFVEHPISRNRITNEESSLSVTAELSNHSAGHGHQN